MFAWLAEKAIPWKLIGVGLAALIVLSSITAGYLYVKGLQEDLEKTKIELTSTKIALVYSEATNKLLNAWIDFQNKRLTKLNEDLNAANDFWDSEIVNIDDLDLGTITQDGTNEANSPAAELNRRNSALNRLLERPYKAGD